MGECISVGGFSKVYILRSKKNGNFFIGKFIDKSLSDDKKFYDFNLIETSKGYTLTGLITTGYEFKLKYPKAFLYYKYVIF